MSNKQPLIIIPGLGDRNRLHKAFVPIWRAWGYDARIFSFGWEDETEDFDQAMQRLIEYIDTFSKTKVKIIGISAGGTVALHALSRRPNIVEKIVTVATPFTPMSGMYNKKLESSLAQIKLPLSKAVVLSLYGLYDQTVPVSNTRSLAVPSHRVFAVRHSIIIGVAMTFYGPLIDHFLRHRA